MQNAEPTINADVVSQVEPGSTPLPQPPEAPAPEQKAELPPELREKLNAMLGNDTYRKFAETMLLSQQLHSLALAGLQEDTQYEHEDKKLFLAVVRSFALDDKGAPRPFDGSVTVRSLRKDIIPFWTDWINHEKEKQDTNIIPSRI